MRSLPNSASRLRPFLSVAAATLGACLTVLAADPPALMNYQGVLRDASDLPLSGSYDVTFRLY
ncbi:MAG TPA: hypothetical protein VFD06_03270, partial [Candidatus Polarisedimenticolia bacterium]|nr:hypothetical protein [Candidatus Polarisedimenticolia bacterium]